MELCTSGPDIAAKALKWSPTTLPNAPSVRENGLKMADMG